MTRFRPSTNRAPPQGRGVRLGARRRMARRAPSPPQSRSPWTAPWRGPTHVNPTPHSRHRSPDFHSRLFRSSRESANDLPAEGLGRMSVWKAARPGGSRHSCGPGTRSPKLFTVLRSPVHEISLLSPGVEESSRRRAGVEPHRALSNLCVEPVLRRLLRAPCALFDVTTCMHGYCVCNVLCRHGITQSSWISTLIRPPQ